MTTYVDVNKVSAKKITEFELGEVFSPLGGGPLLIAGVWSGHPILVDLAEFKMRDQSQAPGRGSYVSGLIDIEVDWQGARAVGGFNVPAVGDILAGEHGIGIMAGAQEGPNKDRCLIIGDDLDGDLLSFSSWRLLAKQTGNPPIVLFEKGETDEATAIS